MHEIELRGVSQRFGKETVLRDINLAVPPGKVLGVIGPNGSGKTTLLKAIGGIPDQGAVLEGDIFLRGRRANLLPPEERGIGYLFQGAPLAKNTTASEDIAIKLLAEGMPARMHSEAISKVAQILRIEENLSKLLRRRCSTLSGGERRLVAIAGLLVGKPPNILFFDEPCVNLHSALRFKIREQFIELFGLLGKTVLYISHDQEEAGAICDELALMHEGRVVQIGTWSELYRKPSHRFVAEFIGNPPMNLLEARGPFAESLCKNPKVKILGIRPEDIALEDGGDFSALAESVTLLDPKMLIRLRIGDGKTLLAVLGEDSRVRKGEKIRFSVRAFHSFDMEGKRIESP